MKQLDFNIMNCGPRVDSQSTFKSRSTYVGETSRGPRGEISRGEASRGEVSKGEVSKGETSKGETSESRAFREKMSNGRRKSRRPLDCKKPLHLVLRADLARPVFLNHTPFIEKTINKFAKKFGIKVYEKSVNANHLHLILKFSHRFQYQCFVRAVSGVLAQRLKFSWLNLPYTRVVQWGRDLKRVCLYVIQNQKEAWGLIRYVPRARLPGQKRRVHHKKRARYKLVAHELLMETRAGH